MLERIPADFDLIFSPLFLAGSSQNLAEKKLGVIVGRKKRANKNLKRKRKSWRQTFCSHLQGWHLLTIWLLTGCEIFIMVVGRIKMLWSTTRKSPAQSKQWSNHVCGQENFCFPCLFCSLWEQTWGHKKLSRKRFGNLEQEKIKTNKTNRKTRKTRKTSLKTKDSCDDKNRWTDARRYLAPAQR